MIKQLIWKQWRESRPFLLLFSAWMVLAVCWNIGYELAHQLRATIGSLSGALLLYSAIAAIVLATRASLGELTTKTLAFTAAIPIAKWKIGLVRILGAIVTLTVPVLLAGSILAISFAFGMIEQAEVRASSVHLSMADRPSATLLSVIEQIMSVTAIATAAGSGLLLILSLSGGFLRKPAQLGFLGVMLFILTLVLSDGPWLKEQSQLIQTLYGGLFPQSLVIHWGYGSSTGSYVDHEFSPYRWPAILFNVFVLSGLVAWFALRYGTKSRVAPSSAKRWFTMRSPVSFIPIRFANQWLALIWLELRQSIPLAISGLVVAILVTILTSGFDRMKQLDVFSTLQNKLPHSMFFIGELWAIVVGTGIYSADLSSNLGNFRKSRPISPSIWFWFKFLVGMVAVVTVLDGATILYCWNSPEKTMTEGMSRAYVACYPILHAVTYAFAVLGTCLFRSAILGGVLAFLLTYAPLLLLDSSAATMSWQPINVANALLHDELNGKLDFSEHGYPIVFGVQLAFIVIASIAASSLAKKPQPTWRFLRA